MKISFYTLGCRLNQSETAVIEQTCQADGYSVVNFNEPSDVVVVNTCTVTEHGDTDTRRLVHRINRINPKAKIALVGCQAQIQKSQLAAMPNVRWVVGNGKKMDFSSILREDEAPAQTRVITPAISKTSFTIPAPGIDRKHTRANIKIQDGCDFFCSFCEIPYARGRARSRDFKDIQKEARALVLAGHKELVITGINVGTYKNNHKTMIDVIDTLEQIRGLHRIRISSIEPTTIPWALIEKMAKSKKLCRHLHIPLQSANNAVLKSMKRKYRAETFRDFIKTAYNSVPGICIGTDIIVGFPTENEQQFIETADCLRAWPIHYCHVFSYSKRHVAKSRHHTDTVSKSIIARRSRILRSLSTRSRQVFYKSHLGSTQYVLFEQKKGGIWHGVTDNYIRVCVISKDNLSNLLLPVKLREVKDNILMGKLLARN